MLNRLKQNYKHAIIQDVSVLSKSYQLTIADDMGDTVTFDRRKLSKDEVNLLETIFKVKDEHIFHPKSMLEEVLYNCLILNEEMDTGKVSKILTFPCRFIHFNFKGTVADQSDFEEAMKNLFSSTNDLLWISTNKGVLVQLIDDHFEDDEIEESLIDTIMSDFFVQLTLYVGSPITELGEIKERFRWESKVFEMARPAATAKNLFVEQDIVPYIFLKDLTEETKKTILHSLTPVLDDRTLLDSVKVYLECNLNTSLAAKKMYMHRNTLQYRVDKFIEKTSIDIKRFPNAVAVYFMFTMLEPARRDD